MRLPESDAYFSLLYSLTTSFEHTVVWYLTRLSPFFVVAATCVLGDVMYILEKNGRDDIPLEYTAV